MVSFLKGMPSSVFFLRFLVSGLWFSREELTGNTAFPLFSSCFWHYYVVFSFFLSSLSFPIHANSLSKLLFVPLQRKILPLGTRSIAFVDRALNQFALMFMGGFYCCDGRSSNISWILKLIHIPPVNTRRHMFWTKINLTSIDSWAVFNA